MADANVTPFYMSQDSDIIGGGGRGHFGQYENTLLASLAPPGIDIDLLYVTWVVWAKEGVAINSWQNIFKDLSSKR